ncbi:C2 domain in Dock180 and Zizimin proteins-domain-containing protein [Microdochium trichocladiopsis]|uniref:C2 domain in Dock180 and Zizimin proteins-domain-containing protein n=1 Tax=Microdochium trichocladiopsis TaxID=1682393 RepID=A0A9P9BW96_9PEZI|nr:C2 domain in Dock180 and Zizimin proteins-domain-containing protein [Microdochium trichocladiopsis]KAH7040380.1 C2 domain in Dock180 and Zizimin proteins-domain-containing protein [Microdochium trichocladiopsis]
MLRIGDESPTSASEPLIDEIASCLREWHSTNFHELLLSRQYGSLDKVSQLIQALDLARRQFLHNVLTTNEYDALREKTVWNLVRGNKLCGGEVIVRDPQQRGRVLTGEDSVVEITKLQSVMSLLDEPPVAHAEITALHHLMVDIRSFAGSSNEPTTLLISLVSRSVGGTVTALSESYLIEIPAGGLMGGNSKDGHMRTLFTDLTSGDIGDAPSADSELFLVVKIRAPQQITAGKPSSRSGSFSQPNSPFSKEKPPTSSSTKASRRSLMWGTTRSAFSRGGIKLDALSEQPEERPQTDRTESREGPIPPSTAGSRGARPSSDGTQVTQMTVDRMVGLGVLKINAIMQQPDEVEHVVTIWSATNQSSFDGQQDDECDILVKHLLDSKSGHYEKSRRAERLQVHLKPFNHQDPDALIKATPTLLSGISKTPKMGFPGAPTKPRSDIYITIHQALLARQNLLSRVGGSATALPSSMHGNNLAVTLEVRSLSGDRIENCIYSASNAEAVSAWQSFATERSERWNQCLRLALSPEEVMTSHVMVTVADLPHPPFAIGYLPLWEQQAFLSDGVHSLLLYKLEDGARTAQPGPTGQGGYLSVPWGPRVDSSDVTGPLATLQVESYLCSTRFSQDRVILGLLKWKEIPKGEIPALLRQVIFVPEIEIVKLLNEVLDALFGVLVDNQENDEYEDLVFSALVRVLDIIHDRRFNLGPLVDQYAETKFNYPFATACLVRSFTRLLSKPTEPETARKLRATLKVVRYILKFITHARDQQKAKEAGIGIVNGNPGFTRHLQNIFKALDSMMRSTAPVLVGSQTLAVQHFHTWLPELTGLLTTEEILHIAIDFIDSCALVKGKLVLYKLVLIINYSKLALFSQPEQRSALCANTVRWIAPHWGEATEVTDQWKDQVRLCCSIIASQADHLGPEVPDYIPKITESFRLIQAAGSQPKNKLSLLFPASYPFPAKPISGEPVRFDESLIELSAVLSALANSPQGMQLELTEDDLASVLKSMLQVHMSILQGEAFPSTWLSVHIYHHKSTMKTLQYLSTIMLDTFLPDPDDAENFDTELWKMFFTTLLKLVGSECLALETFPEQKRRAVWKIAGDVREHGAELLRRTWEAIGWETTADERLRYGLSKMGGYQVQYVPSLVGPIVELCLSVHEGLRRMAVEVLQTMIVSEWTLSDDLSVIQTEMIDCLDRFFKEKAMTESILQKLFVQELLDRFEPLSHIEDDAMYAGLRDLIATVDEFLDLLVAVHGGEVTGQASNLINRLRLMEFLRDMQKEEIFIRYVHQLAHLQAEARNHTEAGLALKLHAELYEWDPTRNTRALRDPDMPEQSHFERKERIYFEMIKHFEDGEAWSSALAAYKELQNQYENNVFDFAKLARTERAIATIYETLAKSERLVPKYFKVVYKGLGFPTALRDKAFICEGSPNERTSAFTDRMQGQYQAAQIITSGDVDSDTEGQFLVVSSVSPHRDLSHPVFQRARVQQPIRDYLLSAHPQMFSVSSKRSTNGPVSTHHAEKTLYTTAESFPTILRRSEIVEVDTVQLGAKETGLERIVRKTQEMTAVEKRLAEGDEEVAQLLVDAIRISVDPESETSVVGYRELLPKPAHKSRELNPMDSDEEDDDDDESDEGEPELSEKENAIKMALVDHAIMLKRCLSSFARSSNPILRKAYQDLYMHFESTFAPEIAVFTPAAMPRDQQSTPSPTWQRSPRLTDSSPPLGQISASGSKGVVEEAASVQPITVRQRGARLSFLGGKRKESLSSGNDVVASPQLNGDGETGHASPDRTKDHGHRMSFFRHGSSDNSFTPAHHETMHSNGYSHHRGTPSMSTAQDRGLKSRDIIDVVEKGIDRGGEHTAVVEGGHGANGESGLMKKASIRKRFSTLKLATKKSKNALMGDVREE